MKRGKRITVDFDSEEDCLHLQRLVARGEPLTRPSDAVVPLRFSPLFKHPLPMSEERYAREAALRRVMSARLSAQAAGAVALREPWVLEEVYMRGNSVNPSDFFLVNRQTGAPATVPNSNGFTPLHLAVQLNDIQCIRVLLNIGVDIDAVTASGFTPLYISIATGSKEAEALLREKGARMHVDTKKRVPGATVLDLPLAWQRESKKSSTSQLDAYVGLPDRQLMY